jgi:ABC-type sugar transport system substrate-binding protein
MTVVARIRHRRAHEWRVLARARRSEVPVVVRNATAPPKEHAVFNKIIVGVDGREGGRDAVALAARLASLFGGELVAVHAYPYELFSSRGRPPSSRPSSTAARRTC